MLELNPSGRDGLFDTCWSLTRPDATAFGLFDTCWSLTRPDATAFGLFLTIVRCSDTC